MLNTEDFIKRLEILLDYYSLNASSFADQIGVQRSSISHLLSGRNKPSLDFVLKIIEVFPDINLYWILHGKEEFLKKNAENKNIGLSKATTVIAPTSLAENIKKDLFDTTEVEKVGIVKSNLLSTDSNLASEIFKIVIFYKNGTFKDFTNDTLAN
jgi:DNA-binding XRE family transcriptional regulator